MITIEKDTPVDVEIVKRSSARAVPRGDKLLQDLVRRSVEVWQGRVDGRVACVWGLIPYSILSEAAWMWLVYTEEDVEEHKFFFVRNSQRYIEYALTLYPTIFGKVDPRNKTGVRWLKWLGAEFGDMVDDNLSFVIRRE